MGGGVDRIGAKLGAAVVRSVAPKWASGVGTRRNLCAFAVHYCCNGTSLALCWDGGGPASQPTLPDAVHTQRKIEPHGITEIPLLALRPVDGLRSRPSRATALRIVLLLFTP